ncbi:hypothetical protein GLOTRDRAFT_118453 [Gloeophyllum trabeum ATCC 11539]|uniref:Uncharacterized protein n=1 Tax=Gloeophyllum trabeum (strain ATCC 11539 / FP-39264 / Madison 617) TaxID=670483 RepID=S7QL42_GLOTA|nr:uncharacterized protein GLOTRDRAFT_118453 [Gloeophyllum trabeum ATCC 11539]EPQ59992.1 hypothetical protein GLOTRDRAFT_118453 [Gloeophyllum trabeum ATCC 11539]
MSISGTYNVTFAILPLLTAQVELLLNYSSWKTILSPDPLLFPNLPNDTVPVVVELGREIQTGPGSIKLDFQEAKLEVPNLSRLTKEPSTPFTFKTHIFVDQAIDVFGSFVEFGLPTSLETFVPADSANVSGRGYPYSVKGAVESNFLTLGEGEEPRWGEEAYRNVSSQTWFGWSLLCGRHTYDYEHPVDTPAFVKGNVTLYPPYVGGADPVTFTNVHGLHATFNFSIAGPEDCATLNSLD